MYAHKHIDGWINVLEKKNKTLPAKRTCAHDTIIISKLVIGTVWKNYSSTKPMAISYAFIKL